MSIQLALIVVLMILIVGYLAKILAQYVLLAKNAHHICSAYHMRDLVNPRVLMGATALGMTALGVFLFGAAAISAFADHADRYAPAEFKGGDDKASSVMSRPMRRKNMPHRKAELKVSGYTPEEIKAVNEVCGMTSRGASSRGASSRGASPHGASAREAPPPANLADLTKKLKYRAEFPSELLTQLHYGQRKLLMSEVDFLTRRGGESLNVVYAGAAPGEHIPYLAQLFPEHRFILYDPAPFRIKEEELTRTSFRIKEELARVSDANEPIKDRIEMHQEYFTDATAEALAKKFGGDMLFISDIRAVEDDMTHAEFEARVEADQEWQKNWVAIMKPKGSLMKFRIPFSRKYARDNRPYRYLDGDIHLQVWAPKTSAETRIELGALGERGPGELGERSPGELGERGLRERDYFLADYEQKLFYHNVIGRDWISYLDHIETLAPGLVASGEVPGLDGCYDCAREITIWATYCSASDSQWTIAELANRASEVTNQRLDKYPHGAEPTVPMCQKRKEILTPSQRRLIDRLKTLGGEFPNVL